MHLLFLLLIILFFVIVDFANIFNFSDVLNHISVSGFINNFSRNTSDIYVYISADIYSFINSSFSMIFDLVIAISITYIPEKKTYLYEFNPFLIDVNC